MDYKLSKKEGTLNRIGVGRMYRCEKSAFLDKLRYFPQKFTNFAASTMFVKPESKGWCQEAFDGNVQL
ncbi:MAG: hypothetical protein D8B56_08490 [Alloprevotella sp.]|nr:MAG: hypothetical protein D8B56_08490 [Alloprevotella sp.]